MPRLAIVVLNWNGADDTIECMNSLLAQRRNVPDIILVDNDSHDDSVARFKKYILAHKEVIHLIENDKNSGFAGGINIGVQYAILHKYEFIGTLNPDAVADENWTTKLTQALDADASLGIATGTMAKNDKKHIDTTGEQFPIWGLPNSRGRDSLLSEVPKDQDYIFASTGGGFIARRSMFEDVGMFDEKFFMYFEDIDLCFRAQLGGYKIAYIPDAVAYHKVGASSSKVNGLTTYNTFKNIPMLVIKNIPTKLLLIVLPRFIVTYCLLFLGAAIKGRGLYALKGWLMSIFYLPHSLLQRVKVQSKRRVTAEYISSIMLHDIPPEQTGLRKFRKLFTGK